MSLRLAQTTALIVLISCPHPGRALARSEAVDPNLDELIALHTDAVGGAKVVEAVHAVEFELRIVEPTFEVDGLYRADRTGRMRIDILAAGKRAFSEGFDGKNGWQWNGGEEHARAASAEGSAALHHGTQLPGKVLGLHELARNGHKVVLVGRETLDGTSYYVLDVTLSDGYLLRYYVDPASYLFARTRDFKALHPDVDATRKRFETRLGDYRRVGGIMRAFSSVQVDLESGQTVQTTTLKAVRTNPSLAGDLFVRP